VAAKSAANGQPVSVAEWAGWNSCQRYALYKTALSKNEPNAFSDVLDELRAANR